MPSHPVSRRRLLSLGILSCAYPTLAAFGGQIMEEDSDWCLKLNGELGKLSNWVRHRTTDGTHVFHCGVSDPATWAGCSARLAGMGNRVIACGNVLTFSLDGRSVSVVMHSTAG